MYIHGVRTLGELVLVLVLDMPLVDRLDLEAEEKMDRDGFQVLGKIKQDRRRWLGLDWVDQRLGSN